MNLDTKTCFRAGLTVFTVYLGIKYWTLLSDIFDKVVVVASPLIFGAAAAYVINILMSMYEKNIFNAIQNKRAKRILALLLSLVSLAAGIIVLVQLIIPEFMECIQLLAKKLPSALNKIVDLINEKDLLPAAVVNELEKVDWNSRINSLIKTISTSFTNAVALIVGVMSRVITMVISGLLSLIFAIYLLLDKEKFSVQTRAVLSHYMKDSWYERFNYVVDVLDDSFHKFIVGQCTEAIVLGLLCTGGMMLLRIPYATMIGTLLGFMAFIPMIGSFIATVIGAFMIFTVSPTKALVFVIFEIVMQQIEGNLIYPKVVGSSIGLPAVLVLIAVTIGGGVFGVVGLLIGVPLTAAIYRIISDDIKKPKKIKE